MSNNMNGTNRENLQEYLGNNKAKKIADAMNRVSADIINLASGYAMNETFSNIATEFNNVSLGMFDYLLELSDKYQKDVGIAKFKKMFEMAAGFNTFFPIQNFAYTVLEVADRIYTNDVDFLLNLPMPDPELQVEGEFDILKTTLFKDLYKNAINDDEREHIFVILNRQTLWGHIYFAKNVFQDNGIRMSA